MLLELGDMYNIPATSSTSAFTHEEHRLPGSALNIDIDVNNGVQNCLKCTFNKS